MSAIRDEWISKDGRIRLLLGDCIQSLASVEEGTIDLFIADPPYGIDYQSARRTDKSLWLPKIKNDSLPFVWWLYHAFSAASDDSACMCFCRWDVQEAFRSAMLWAGFSVKSQVIWNRESHGMGDLNGSPAPQHDVIWFGTKGKYKFSGSRPKSIISAARVCPEDLVHPNEKPAALMEQIVDSYCRPDGVVCSPFLGSGVDAIACIRTGRKFTGIEIEKKYFDIAVDRVKRELAQPMLPALAPTPDVQHQLFKEEPK